MMFVLFWCVIKYPQNSIINGLIAGNVINAMGFTIHDACHRYVTNNNKYQDAIAWFFGDVIFGVCSVWWREEHFDHHGLTNVYEVKSDNFEILDIQSDEDFWSGSSEVISTNRFDQFHHLLFIKYQHIFIWPLCLIFGRYGIQVDCWIKELKKIKNRWRNFIGWVIHWTVVICLSRSSKNPWGFYAVLHVYQGLMAVMLVGNHVHRKWREVQDVKHQNFGIRNAEATVNYCSSPWTDWFYGGLHFHIEHHLLPKLPRYNQR